VALPWKQNTCDRARYKFNQRELNQRQRPASGRQGAQAGRALARLPTVQQRQAAIVHWHFSLHAISATQITFTTMAGALKAVAVVPRLMVALWKAGPTALLSAYEDIIRFLAGRFTEPEPDPK